MRKNMIVLLILAVLVLVAAVQAVHLTTLKAKIDAGAVKVGGASKVTVATPGASGTGSGIDSLPTMVGGC
ncbi:hypothetical protein HY640_05230 [Candidatus Woesearchaeota archaeon]|nr:hypothetical protein [Candidatus Woesearchaeota archaeon]